MGHISHMWVIYGSYKSYVGHIYRSKMGHIWVYMGHIWVIYGIYGSYIGSSVARGGASRPWPPPLECQLIF